MSFESPSIRPDEMGASIRAKPLFGSQRRRQIGFQEAPSRQQAGQRPDREQQQTDAGEHPGIARADALDAQRGDGQGDDP